MLGVFLTLQFLSYLRLGILSPRGARISQRHGRGVLDYEDANPYYLNVMEDEELLWSASMVHRRPKPPEVVRIPKIAFMFLAVGPLPLAPLWEMYFKGNEDRYNIYVHSLPGYNLEVEQTSPFFGRHVRSQATKWGDLSMCDAERRLLANALLDQDNERFVLLSETCVPLWTFNFTYDYLMKSNQSFVGAFDDPGPVGRGRYDERMLPEVSIEQWRKGSQWFEVDRELATYIVSDVKYYPKFRDFCKPICYVDEHYIPTMLNIEFPKKVAMRSVTAVDWTKGGAHPGEFGKDDAVEFYQRIRSGHDCTYNGESGHLCFIFARKFLPESLEPLLARNIKHREFG